MASVMGQSPDPPVRGPTGRPPACSSQRLWRPCISGLDSSSRESVDSPTEQPGNLAGISCTIHILPLSTMHTALSYTATLDPSSAATCAPPPAHARAPIHALSTRHTRVPNILACARVLRCRWSTRVADSTNLGHAEIQHENCTHAHENRTRHGGQQARDRAFPLGFSAGATHLMLRSGHGCRPAASLGDGGPDRLCPRARPWRIRATAEPTGAGGTGANLFAPGF